VIAGAGFIEQKPPQRAADIDHTFGGASRDDASLSNQLKTPCRSG